MSSNTDVAREHIFKDSVELSGKSIAGYDFNMGVNFSKLVDSFSTMGAQASNLSRAIEIVNEMRSSGAKIFLGYTSSMVSGGLRDIFRYLVEHKLVDVVVTTVGGVEEDIIKCFGDFKLGSFDLDGVKLREQGVNRAGNVLIPNSRYQKFEDFMIPFFSKLTEEQKSSGEIISPSKLIHRLGEAVDDKRSICYWAFKNDIPIFCPAITDGSLGDMLYFFKSKNPEFKLDVSDDIVAMNDSTFGVDKTGMIILGSGVVKHHICNANLFRNGADFAVYINTASEFDGSDAGARPEEAVSWGKISPNAKFVKVFADASIVFPLLVAKTFASKV